MLASSFRIRTDPCRTFMLRIDCREISGDDFAASAEIRRACECLSKEGYAILDHAFTGETVLALKAEFDSRHEKGLQDGEFDQAVTVGNKRIRIPIDLSGPFGSPEIYANPFVVALVRTALEHDAILETFGAVLSFDGSKPQHVHRDGGPLFGSAIAPFLPAHALTFVIPLVEMNDVTGTTILWPGSHRLQDRDGQVPPQALEIPLGSCALWDSRIFHGGTSNRSGTHRPILHGTYARPWYRDPDNFENQSQNRLSYGPEFLGSVPKEAGDLFARVR
jgi:ectoine hydroxylase-related dioxygenase (phytanoyl-CoA dioxygenase family)